MQKNWMVWACLTAALVLPTVARAHEGHVHNALGTISSVQSEQVALTTRDGKTLTVVLNKKTAVTRGKVTNTSVPNWLLGGARVKTAVANRETARIEKLKQQQDAVVAARASRCPRSAG